jgi:type IV pilus assembly protein PilB
MERKLKVGEFLVQNGIITREQLSEALEMQRDNPERLVGEILVTQGFITRDELIMAMEAYLMTTNTGEIHVDEWLDQEEIDMLIEKIREQG